jgi:nitrate reductase gamma subunit
MMDAALEFARGPLFVACFFLMVLGLSRLVFLRIYEYQRAWKRAARDRFPFGRALQDMGRWLIPVTHIYSASPTIGVLSFLFHIGLILVPIFLAEHVLLWRRGVGIGWATLPAAVADGLTILAIVTGAGLLGIRTFGSAARFMSQWIDYFLLVLLLIPLLSGLAASHPTWNPFSYQCTMLVHALAGDLVMALMPFTKLSHAVLFPFERMSSEVYWRFPAGAGDRVAGALHGKEPAVL